MGGGGGLRSGGGVGGMLVKDRPCLDLIFVRIYTNAPPIRIFDRM